jgi:hypothetical protein
VVAHGGLELARRARGFTTGDRGFDAGDRLPTLTIANRFGPTRLGARGDAPALRLGDGPVIASITAGAGLAGLAAWGRPRSGFAPRTSRPV